MRPQQPRHRSCGGRHMGRQHVVDSHQAKARREPRFDLEPEERRRPGKVMPEADGRTGGRRPADRFVMDLRRGTPAACGRGEERVELDTADPAAAHERPLEDTAVAAAEVDEPVVKSDREQVQRGVCNHGVETTERSEHLRIAPAGCQPRRSDMACRRKHQTGILSPHGETGEQATHPPPVAPRAGSARKNPVERSQREDKTAGRHGRTDADQRLTHTERRPGATLASACSMRRGDRTVPAACMRRAGKEGAEASGIGRSGHAVHGQKRHGLEGSRVQQ